jgi:hypothetical protein
MQCLSFWLISFQVSMTWTSDFRVHLWQYFQLVTKQSWGGGGGESSFWNIICIKKLLTASLDFIIFFVWIRNSPFVINCFRNSRTSQKSTNVNQSIVPISKRRYELDLKSILSLKGDRDLPLRGQTPYRYSGWQKPKWQFKTSWLWILVSA